MLRLEGRSGINSAFCYTSTTLILTVTIKDMHYEYNTATEWKLQRKSTINQSKELKYCKPPLKN